MKVLALTRYGRRAASTRQRLLQYLPALAAAGIDVRYHALLDDDYVGSLTGRGDYSKRKILSNYWSRMRLLRRARADLIWVYGELFPYLPATFERLAFASGAPVVYDFDDAFFHNYDQSPQPIVRHLLGRKFEPMLRGAAGCAAGNPYLARYASPLCSNTIVLPTVVDTDQYCPVPPPAPDVSVTIGWIGSPSTWSYVRPLLPLLSDLARSRGIRVRIVGAGAKAEADRFPEMDLIEWSEDTEILDVQAMQIGIMPVPDLIWAQGKSGYKLIQYMACGLPVLASPVGVNNDIVIDGTTGFLCRTEEDWRSALVRLIDDPALRRSMGQAGRMRAVERYSLASQAPRFIDLLRGALRPES